MRGLVYARWLVAVAGLLVVTTLLVPRADAFEAFDGRLQAHGFFESQMRFVSRNFGEQWDMAQWYNILNVELELDIIDENPFGPIDYLSAFMRIEARYDCVYSHGCGMFNSVNTYGNDSEDLPRRLNNDEITDAAGSIFIDNKGRRSRDSRDPVDIGWMAGFQDLSQERSLGFTRPEELVGNNTEGYQHLLPPHLFNIERPKAFDYTMSDFADFEFTHMGISGGSNNGHATFILGPWLPKNEVHTLSGAMANRVNPYDTTRRSPASLYVGRGALPMRPIPVHNEDSSEWDTMTWSRTNAELGTVKGEETLVNLASNYRKDVSPDAARGLFYPSQPLSRYLKSGAPSSYDFNFTERQRSWNRGASQQDEKELKEAYVDLEMFDSRLWLRAGKQTIIWGKTELFPTVDQWNPQDLALGSLVSLEESRIALWALRGVYSFYEVGPLEDFRLELAFNFDEFEPADLGACGEPYTPNAVCGITMGSFAHSFAGIGIAGIEKPPAPWQSLEGWEVGGRVEFRWNMFSFSISDWYGFSDFPHIERISTYERNVDAVTGRPRIMGGYGPCATQDFLFDRTRVFDRIVSVGNKRRVDNDCLRPGPTYLQNPDGRDLRGGLLKGVAGPTLVSHQLDLWGDRFFGTPYEWEQNEKGKWVIVRDKDGDPVKQKPLQAASGEWVSGYVEHNSLEWHPANQTLFAFGCSATFGSVWKDPGACGVNALNDRVKASTSSEESIVHGAAALLAGNMIVTASISNFTDLPFELPLNTLDQAQPSDMESLGCISLYADWQGGNVYKEVGCGGENGDRSGTGGQSLGNALSPEQEALLGCGPFFGTSCDWDGLDLLNADASALLQSFIGWDNALSNGKPKHTLRTDNRFLNEWDTNHTFYDPEKYADAPDDEKYRYALKRRYQPGTLDFMAAETPDGRPIAGPVCSTGDLRDGAPYNHRSGAGVLPGCRWTKLLQDGEYVPNPFYDPVADGRTTTIGVKAQQNNNGTMAHEFPGFKDPGKVRCLGKRFGSEWPDYDDFCTQVLAVNGVSGPVGPGEDGKGHPFTGDDWASEMAALSWNFQMIVLGNSDEFQAALYAVEQYARPIAENLYPGDQTEQDRYVRAWQFTYSYTGTQEAERYLKLQNVPFYKKVGEQTTGRGIYNREKGRFLENNHCSFITPQFCPLVQDLMAAAGQKRNTVDAGGNGTFGRRTFAWHSGGEILLKYDKRNVLGFAVDFAEDWSKSSWGIEATWIEGVKMIDNNSPTNVSSTDEFNMTIAIDRPSFFNFLNPNRTFFITTQWFVTYRPGYNKGYTSNGPWNVLGMVFLQTDYFQARLVANQVFVYDIMSNSGGALTSVMYRISENFSVTFGVALFMGRREYVDMPLNEIGPTSNRLGDDAYRDSTENGLAAIRDRDEVYLRVRYTF